jgi:hypothetical protein
LWRRISVTFASWVSSRPLIACGYLGVPLDEPDRELDIPTFRLTKAEAERIGKRPILARADPWPTTPKRGEQVMSCGFPARQRVRIAAERPDPLSGIHRASPSREPQRGGPQRSAPNKRRRPARRLVKSAESIIPANASPTPWMRPVLWRLRPNSIGQMRANSEPCGGASSRH